VISYLRFFEKAVSKLNDWVGRIVSFAILPITMVIVYEVVMRYAFNRPTLWAHELSCFFFGAYFILAGGYVLRLDAHIRVGVFYDHLPRRVKAVVDLFTWVLFYVFCGVVLWKGVIMASFSVSVREYMPTPWGAPVWPLRLTVPAGALLLLLQGVTKTISDFFTAITGAEWRVGR
jgi:TRAP-type mannitol/chloroaromatic compound transport system permease small subunit